MNTLEIEKYMYVAFISSLPVKCIWAASIYSNRPVAGANIFLKSLALPGYKHLFAFFNSSGCPIEI
jgi:hypothetical protein